MRVTAGTKPELVGCDGHLQHALTVITCNLTVAVHVFDSNYTYVGARDCWTKPELVVLLDIPSML